MTRPLKLYYSDNRGDYFTTGTAEGEHDSVVAGYRFVRTEGYCREEPAAGTVPLQLFYSEERGDNFTTATTKGANDAAAAGYRFVRTEGYVYSEPGSGRVPLQLYYSPERGDNFVTATEQGAKNAVDAGYSFVRTEAYVDAQPLGTPSVSFPLTGHESWQQSAMHMDAVAYLTQDGQLRAEITTWSSWKLKGFTGGCLVLVVDAHENVIHTWLTWPLGVDGTWIGRSRRVDFPQTQLDAETTARAARLVVACSHMGKNRWDDIVKDAEHKVEVVLEAIKKTTG